MDSINTILIIDIIIVILGVYLLFLALKMKKTKKVEAFIIAEEALKNCKQEEEFAEYLSVRQLCFAVVMMIGGTLMAIHEAIFDLGYWHYLITGIVAVAFLVFYKQLTDGRLKYC